MSKKRVQKRTLEELILLLQESIEEYKFHKSVECFKKLKKTCRQISTLTVNPTIPPPPPKP